MQNLQLWMSRYLYPSLMELIGSGYLYPNGLRACLVCGRSGVQIPDRPNLTQRYKRFVTRFGVIRRVQWKVLVFGLFVPQPMENPGFQRLSNNNLAVYCITIYRKRFWDIKSNRYYKPDATRSIWTSPEISCYWPNFQKVWRSTWS